MPEPIITLQRSLAIVGAIRAGGEKPERGVGRKLEAWRITSPRKQLCEQIATLYGGTVTGWKSPVGDEFQVYTEADELPILVMPDYSLRQTYELWEGATKRTRVCDGVEEEISGGPCLCNAEGVDRCDLYTRLTVCLPELDTVLGWRLITKGAYAGHELPTMIRMISAISTGQTFVPARLRLDQKRGVKDGQVVRFVVPTLDLGVSYLALSAPAVDGSARALPAGGGFTPAPRRELTAEQALDAAVAPPTPPSPGRRRAAAFGPDDVDDGPPPIPPEDDDTRPSASRPTETPAPAEPRPEQPTASNEGKKEEENYDERRQTLRITDPQKAKLNVLVGKLREAGHITTESLWAAMAGLRNVTDVEHMIELDHGRDAEGDLHWAPLRDSLTRPEAMQLIEWLSVKEDRVAKAPAAAATEPLPYGEFPPGY